MDKRNTGFLAENYAASLLQKRGYKILERNFRTRFSEIDIVAKDCNTLVFVEVKARWSQKFGAPEESVNAAKIEKIKKAGEIFFIKNKDLPKKFRIDVVSLLFEGKKLISEKIIKVY